MFHYINFEQLIKSNRGTERLKLRNQLENKTRIKPLHLSDSSLPAFMANIL